ncbi:hypothetical protein LUZ60_008978 [Juncus effusus]|nr:hypothetical protein LUZ60_008978 [Juncus effusus]
MDSSDSGLMNEPAGNSNLTLEEKREIVYQVSQNPQNAPEILQSWSKKELLELLCTEMGKERKYTGLTKPKMINQLLTVVSRNANLENFRAKDAKSPNKRKRKSMDANGENLKGKDGNSPKRKSTDTNSPNGVKKRSMVDVNEDNLRVKDTNSPNGVKKKSLTDVNGENLKSKHTNSPNRLKRKTLNNSRDQTANSSQGSLCKNAACKARLNKGDIYCKRCSCCVCHKYDENKDPSLWIECNSDPPFEDESCGATCHLKCVLRHEGAGVQKKGIDGGFYCVFCGKVNSILGCLKKQLAAATTTRRVDSLRERLSLSRKILKGTEKYAQIEKFIVSAVGKLKKEAGPLDRVCSGNVARGGIVNRLSCGGEVQRLCGEALAALDGVVGLEIEIEIETNNNNDDDNVINSNNVNDDGDEEEEDDDDDDDIKINNSNSNSNINNNKTNIKSSNNVKSNNNNNSNIKKNNKKNDNSNTNEKKNQPKHQVSDDFQIRFEEITDSSITVTLITKDSMFARNIIGCSVWQSNCKSVESGSKTDYLILRSETKILLKGLNPSTRYFFKARPFSPKGELGQFEADCCTKGRNGNPNGSNGSNESLNGSNFTSKPSRINGEERYEYCVRVIRWLEGENFLEREFRVRFLTWFSVKATEQERRVVGTFIDVLLDEPADLVKQLVHSFSERIGGKEREREKFWGDKKEVLKGFKGEGCMV